MGRPRGRGLRAFCVRLSLSHTKRLNRLRASALVSIRYATRPAAFNRTVLHLGGVQFEHIFLKFVTMDEDRFAALQRSYFENADVKRFLWQTRNPYVSEKEKQLLSVIAQDNEKKGVVLEVGCGEGANLVNIGQDCGRIVGVDLSLKKTQLCRRVLDGKREVVCADAGALPFNGILS